MRDYVTKNGFHGAVLGLSGGIDSALTLAIAYDAIGADKVQAVMMPFRYTAQMSVEDAKEQAERMGVEFNIISIEPMFEGFMAQLAPLFEGHSPRHHRREPAGPLPWRAVDGALQQASPHRADHWQQERDGGGLCHPVR